MVNLDLQPELEAKLSAEANARGLDLNRYVESLLSERGPEAFNREAAARAVERIRELRKGNNLGGLSIKDLVNEGRKY